MDTALEIFKNYFNRYKYVFPASTFAVETCKNCYKVKYDVATFGSIARKDIEGLANGYEKSNCAIERQISEKIWQVLRSAE